MAEENRGIDLEQLRQQRIVWKARKTLGRRIRMEREGLRPVDAILHRPDFGEKLPVIFNCLGTTGDGSGIPELLVRQVQSSVYFEDSIRTMARMVDAVVEIGPGQVLSGFVRRTAPELPVLAVETAQELEQLPRRLRELDQEVRV